MIDFTNSNRWLYQEKAIQNISDFFKNDHLIFN